MGSPVVHMLMLGLALGLPTAARSTTPEEIEFFESRIRPVLVERCYACHSADADKVRAGLLLDTPDGLLAGGDSGPALVPGDPDASLLIKAIRYSDPDLRMPPKNGKLGLEQVADFEAWVRMGAPDPRASGEGSLTSASPRLAEALDHWAFQPVIRPPVPEVANPGRVENAIDAFVLAGLEAQGMGPSAPADRRAWLRRVTYDVTGLPPRAEEMDAFLADESGEARARVVDRLLASPRYGERWGRYWLDVARYADTKGYVFQEERRYPYAHAYRDYVIESLNSDKPYDRFLLEQLAADQLELGDDDRALAAMGFLTVGRRFLNNPHDIIDDRIDVVFRGLQGLTVSCARCHDHKFEPIPTREYYSLYGVFASSEEPDEKPVLRRTIDPDARSQFIEEQARLQAAVDDKTNEEIAKFSKQIRERSADYETAAQRAIEEEMDEALDKLAAEANLVVQVLQRVVDSRKSITAGDDSSNCDPFDLSPDDVRQWAEVQISEATAKVRNQLAELEIEHPGAPVRAMVLVDKPEPVDPVVFVRGNPGNRGEAVPRQMPGILSGAKPEPFRVGSGRLELAHAIANSDNPLTARVIVNRVWLGHFGHAIVRTPSDFGVRTEAPRHRALLDYLSAWLIDNGWSLKRLHRLILLSNTYGQASDDNQDYTLKDPTNELLWKMNRRRLDFEALRDTLLAAGGHLDMTVGGRAVEITGNDPAPRRTVYGFIDRQNLPSLFRTFDLANPDTTSPQRFTTTVPQQALYLMNSPFVVRQAQQLMARPELIGAESDSDRVRTLYRLLYQREPALEESELGKTFIVAQAAHTPTRIPGPAWQYGSGTRDEAQTRVNGFVQFEEFVSDRWQPGAEYPAPGFGHLALNANGGHPGPDASLSAIRRWVAPMGGLVSIDGRLEHPSDQGDGVRAVIVHSGVGLLGQWEVLNSSTETTVAEVRVAAGDILDFVVEPRETASHDSFNWAPRVRLLEVDPFESVQTAWNAAADFAGPGAPTAKPLDPWERYAQVLLQANELAFVD